MIPVSIGFEINAQRLEINSFIKPFQSEDEDLNNFLLFDAKNYLNEKVPNRKRKGVYPAVKIGRLAVSKKYIGRGMGKLILRYIEDMFLSNDQKTGCRFITVDAYRVAANFYLRNGYKFFIEKDNDKDTRIMYFDLKSI